MPSRVKLLSAATPGTTGSPFRMGMGQPPYSIRTIGGYTNGAGTAGTNGVSIETSPDFTPANPAAPTAAEIAAATWDRAIGIVGGQNETETQTGEFVDLHADANCVMQYYARWFRAKFGSSATGTATVYLEMPR